MEQDRGDKKDWRTKGFGQRLGEARPTKTLVFWAWVASVVVIMIIGFTWGGWVTGRTARDMAAIMAEEAVVKRLVPICVRQFKQDPGKDQKLKELKEKERSYERGEYVKKQGWATMPGEEEADSNVAEECAKLLVLIGQ
jgi:hypothetical protein